MKHWRSLYSISLSFIVGALHASESVFIPLETAATLQLKNAVMTGNLENCRYLLEAKANPNVQDSEGRTPLFYVCRAQELEGRAKFSIIKLLIQAGVIITLDDIKAARTSSPACCYPDGLVDFLRAEYHRQNLHTYDWCKRKCIECFFL